jgi:kumamolisin
MEDSHTPVVGSRRVPLPGAAATGRANPHATIEVSLKLRRKNDLPPVKERPVAIMTRDQLADHYGASKEDLDLVVQTFKDFGLKPTNVDAATRTVRLSGPIAAMEQAFQVRLFNYDHESGAYRGRVGQVHVPIALKDIVKGVFGLDNRRVARPRRQPIRDIAQIGSSSVPQSWYIPSQLAKHYNFPAGDGTGQTVGLLEFGGGYFPNDLKKFCKLAGVTVPKVIAVSTDGTPTDSKDGAEGEVMLDIEVVAGVCPKANIVVYFAQWSDQGWITALDAVMKDKENDPGVLSVSWGNAEDTDIWTGQAMAEVNESLKEAALLGITVCAPAGDDGSSDGDQDGQAHADFPGSSVYVLSVGGTTIPAKNGTVPDIVWKEGDGLRADKGGSTGGGVSAVFSRPDWQKDITILSVNPGSIVGRCLPDISANADWNASPYLLVVDGGQQPNGGTSASTPLLAALITLINAARGPGKRIGYLTPLLYRAQDGAENGLAIGAIACTDVISGNNNTSQLGGYSAGTGYDAASGWGRPDGMKLASVLPR